MVFPQSDFVARRHENDPSNGTVIVTATNPTGGCSRRMFGGRTADDFTVFRLNFRSLHIDAADAGNQPSFWSKTWHQ